MPLTGPLTKFVEYLGNLVKKLNSGESLNELERSNLLSYLSDEGAAKKLSDTRPGFEEMPRMSNIKSSDRFYRGSSADTNLSSTPLFTFRNQFNPALDYSSVFGPTRHGIVDEFSVKGAQPARYRDMLRSLIEDKSLLPHLQNEIESTLGIEPRDISGLQDYLYTPTFRRELGNRGFNSVLAYEDAPKLKELHEALITLDPSILIPRSRTYIGDKAFLNDYLSQGISTKNIRDDLFQLGKPQIPGKFWEQKKHGGLSCL